MAATCSCAPDPDSHLDVGVTGSALQDWASGEFQQILRVNANETKVRNRCELTLRLSEAKPLTFTGSDPMGWGAFPSTVGWMGSAVSVPNLSVTGCSGYPCEVTAVYRSTWEDGTGVRCELVADDGSTRLVGTSGGASVNLVGTPAAAVVSRQSVKLGPSGEANSGMCVLEYNVDPDPSDANVTDFGVFVNGTEVTTPTAAIMIDPNPWPTKLASPGFGNLFVGADSSPSPGAIRLKHVTPRSEQLLEGDGLQCAGTFNVAPATPLFDVNVSRPIAVPGGVTPQSNGLSLVTGATGWTCDPATFGTGNGCDCSCGIVDPDCAEGECTPSATPREFWITDWPATVYTVALGDGVVYLGGSFKYVGPPTGSFAAIDAASGLPDFTQPRVNGVVNVVTPDGFGGSFIGGDFSAIDGIPRSGLAHITASGDVDPLFAPQPNDIVHSLAVSGTTLYVGGEFTHVAGQVRNRIAALSTSTGAATSWNPNADGPVYALAVSGSTVYVGGEFTRVGGQLRNSIAALSASTGAATSWNPNVEVRVDALAVSGSTVFAGGAFINIGGGQLQPFIAAIDASTGLPTSWNPGANGRVRSLAVSGAIIYAGGDFTSIGGQARNRIAAFDASTGAVTSWNPNANQVVQSLAVSGSTVYAGGSFTSIGGQPRSYIAALDGGTGLATSWAPLTVAPVHSVAVSGSTVFAGGSFTSIGGPPRNKVAALDTSTGVATSWDPNPNATITSLAVSGSTVYVGGPFTSIGGQARNRIAALDTSTGLATSWNPNADQTVESLAVSGSTVYVGGSFTSIGGQARNRIAALEVSTGTATSWDPNASSYVRSLACRGSTVYAGGAFNNIGGGSYPQGLAVFEP